MPRQISVALGMLLALVLTTFASSYRADAVTLIPPSLEFSGRGGETIPSKIKLFNETTSPITLFSSAANFSAKDETGTPDFDTATGATEDLASWIKVGPGPFEMKSGEFVEIPIEVAVPADAAPGGHYAGVFFSSEDPNATEPSQITIGAKIGTLILVRIEGQINEIATIAEFSVPRGTFSRPPVTFTLRVKNQGNVHVRPTGDITIRNMLGGTTAIVPVNSKQDAALPTQIRRFEPVWEKSSVAATKGNFLEEVGREWNNFAVGPYTATTSLKYGQAGDKTLTAVVNFWIFPWRVLLVSLIVIALVVLLLVVVIKRYNRWIVAKSKGQSAGS